VGKGPDPAATVDGLFRLDGRVAIVTGGTRGIGRAIAEGFAAAGARVVVSSRKSEAVDRTASELAGAGHDVAGVACHMGEPSDVRQLVAATVERFGGIDVVVNNAANALTEPVGAFSQAGFDKSFGVNVKGPVWLIQEALPYLEKSDGASVINVVTAGAWLFSGFVSMYAAGKAAMVSFTKSMAAELAPRNVRVNALAPGAVDTDMVRANPEEGQRRMTNASLQRRLASPSEMIGPALFLASRASSFMTGSVLHVDGGLVPT
jgi:NAD(P)-dependent dehydrogenase (short-subunit alcohol dehydrogenase family)